MIIVICLQSFKVLVLSNYFIHTREQDSTPGVVWCVNSLIVIILIGPTHSYLGF